MKKKKKKKKYCKRSCKNTSACISGVLFIELPSRIALMSSCLLKIAQSIA